MVEKVKKRLIHQTLKSIGAFNNPKGITTHHIEVHQNVLVALQHLSICKLDRQLAGLNLQLSTLFL